MILWLDAQLSPSIAPWITSQLGLPTVAVRDLGLLDASYEQIFHSARAANAILVPRDADFSRLVARFGTPPAVIWLRCGNTSNVALKRFLHEALRQAIALVESGEALIEILHPDQD